MARLSVTGELGYELNVGAQYLQPLLQEIMRVGAEFAVRHVGLYALNSLRLEKSFGIWSREFSRDYTPRMAGLQRFIDYDRAGFIEAPVTGAPTNAASMTVAPIAAPAMVPTARVSVATETITNIKKKVRTASQPTALQESTCGVVAPK